MLRGRARRGQGDAVLDDPLDAAQERRVRAVLALGGVARAGRGGGGGPGRARTNMEDTPQPPTQDSRGGGGFGGG
ncbi:hypothetical protein ACFW4O_29600, partial [Streptomyces mutabilis]